MQRVYGAVASCGCSNASALLRFQLEARQLQSVAECWRRAWFSTPLFGFCRDFCEGAAPPKVRRPNLDETDPSEPYEVRVAATSRPGAVAGFLLNALRHDRQLKAVATGKAVYTMIRSAAIANSLLQEDGSENSKKRIVLRPVLEVPTDFKDATYQINFQPQAIDWPSDLIGYKDMRISAKSIPVAFRAALIRSLIDEGVAGVSGAGHLVAVRAIINTAESCMRLRTLMPNTFDTVVVPGLKKVANDDGTMLHLFHLLVIRVISSGASAPGGLLLHPQALTDSELHEAVPEPIMDRQHFCEYAASTARWFKNERSRPTWTQPINSSEKAGGTENYDLPVEVTENK